MNSKKIYLINSNKRQISGSLCLGVEKLIVEVGIRELLGVTELFSILTEVTDTWGSISLSELN